MKIKTIHTSFPDDIHGIVFAITQKQSNGFLIVIDDRNTAEKQSFSLRHELSHIALNHFERTIPIETAEKQADSLAEQLTIDELMQLCK